ncbi:hypothetical protein I5393_05670 [Citrobacter freundii]|uniref:hypothetical protein n=1 Tax=Citrobacter freundii TaxID=546 RepID=UPI00190065AD|nr:hypothetical protein [Citrobacter freundii]MBJ8767872.1 hypothetical protein [Citrobacter freundii]
MKDQYVEGKDKSSLDEQITGIAKKARSQELGGKSMVTAIQNEAGDIYRIITVEGLGAYMSLAMGIAGLGLVDLHADNLAPGKYDSLFIFKK